MKIGNLLSMTDASITTDKKTKWNQYLFVALCTSMLVATCIMQLYNYLFTHYQSTGFDFPNLWRQTFEGILFFIGSYSISAKYSRVSTSLRAVGIFLMMIFCYSAMLIGTSLTPNTHLIDQQLHHFDQFLGYNTIGVMHWLHQHQWIGRFLIYCYNFLGIEIYYLIGPWLCFFSREKELLQTVNLTLLCSFIGSLIYYIIPSSAPADVITSPYFIQFQTNTAIAFFQQHHHLPITVSVPGGIIGFPSFHVLLALSVIYLFRNNRWLFYPAIIMNTCIIASTFLLGIHFLADSIASVVIFATCYLLLKRAEYSYATE